MISRIRSGAARCLACAAISLSAACAPASQATELRLPPAIAVVPVRMQTVRPSIDTHGTIVHSSMVEVFPAFEAPILRLHVEVGDWVGSGDPLAILDSARIDLALDQAYSSRDARRAARDLAQEQVSAGRREVEMQLIRILNSERELEQRTREYQSVHDLLRRREELHAVGGVTNAEIESLRTQYRRVQTDRDQIADDLAILSIGYRDHDIVLAGLPRPDTEDERLERLVQLHTTALAARLRSAEAEYRIAELDVVALARTQADATIRAPVAGRIAFRGADEGGVVRPAEALFSVMQVDPVLVVAQISEQRIEQISPGAEVMVMVGRDRRTVLDGAVSLVAPRVDATSRTGRIQARLANSAGLLLPGMFAAVRIFPAPPIRAAVVPDQAVVAGSPETLFLVRDGALLQIPVATIETADVDRAVVGPLSDGDLLAVQPQPWFRDGIAVTPVTEDGL